MLREALTQQCALCVGNGQAILVGDDPIPEGADVTHLVFRRQVVKTRRRKGKRVCHGLRIARGGRLANTCSKGVAHACPTYRR